MNKFESSLPPLKKKEIKPENELGGYEFPRSDTVDNRKNDKAGIHTVTKLRLIEREGEDINLIQKAQAIRKTAEYKGAVKDLKKVLEVGPEKISDRLESFAVRGFEDFKNAVLYNLRPEIIKEHGGLDIMGLLVNLRNLHKKYEQLHQERANEWLDYKKSEDNALDAEMYTVFKKATERYGKILENLKQSIDFVEDVLQEQNESLK